MSNESKVPALILDNLTPTLFVDYDGTLHRGHALLDASGNITLDTGNPLFEFVPQLERLLNPYPRVEIVLTTSWLDTLPFEKVVSYLPPVLAKRVVGTTRGIKPRFGYLQDGSARTYIIRSYVFAHRLKNWLAIDDSVFGAYHLNTDVLRLEPHLVLLDPRQGISSPESQRRIGDWLVEVHRTDGG
ncbi:HAD domain-containing protein [Burkholderia thailandensis]|uniref:HAD domain-containing protein n=1 Tax=Burkholderia thailandensis TaxID=57975 RepID=UPI002165A2AB|nr:HAD domain-containing protein [Burkholderia thailandensis]MCS3390363.1 HAD domain-containing protein [Burkholderia thailandensis]